jgi:hypothetical protein
LSLASRRSRAGFFVSCVAFAASVLALTVAAPVPTVEASTPSGQVVVWGAAGSAVLKVPAAAASKILAISASPFGDDVLAITREGTVIAWGANTHGESNVPAGLSHVKAVSAGQGFSLALKSDGSVVAWGDDSKGQTDVPAAAGSGVTAIAAGAGFALAVKSDGTLVGWGSYSGGALLIPAKAGNIESIDASVHVLAISRSGYPVAWGINSSGQSTVPAKLGKVKAVSAGGNFSLALRTDGTLVGWGNKASGQLKFPCTNPTLCANSARVYSAIAAGGSHALGLLPDGTIRAWGSNSDGQTKIPANLGRVIGIAAGRNFSVALVQHAPPASPTKITTEIGNASVRVSWDAPIDDGGAPIKGYIVASTPGGSTCKTTGATTCVVPGLKNGTKYTFKVSVITAIGRTTSAVSKPVTPSKTAPYLAPTKSPTPTGPIGATAGGVGTAALLLSVLLAIVGVISLAFAVGPGLLAMRRDRLARR